MLSFEMFTLFNIFQLEYTLENVFDTSKLSYIFIPKSKKNMN